MKTFIIGDIHGAFKALKQVLERSNFNYKNDRLICLGDVCDGYPEVDKCFNELLKINNLVYLLGNHDKWSLGWMLSGELDYTWYFQGGKWTIHSYTSEDKECDIPQSHINLLNYKAKDYLIENNVLFVHGGFDTYKEFSENTQDDFIWNRSLFSHGVANDFDKVYVGHTTCKDVTTRGNVTCLDTGAGHGGRLTMMNIDSGEVFKSDKTRNMYPSHEPRG